MNIALATQLVAAASGQDAPAGPPAAEWGAGLWLPPEASSYAARSDALFYFLLAVSVVVFLLLAGTALYFAWKYRRREEGHLTGPGRGGPRLPLLVGGVLAALFLSAFGWGQFEYASLKAAPSGALDVQATARSWSWTFYYPVQNKKCSVGDPGEPVKLVVPDDQPVKITLNTADDPHSLWIPAFRVNQATIPGRETTTWFSATRPGIYDIYSAEFSGAESSKMRAKAYVVSRDEFENWVASSDCLAVADDDGPGQYKLHGCDACHTIDGSKKVGPSFKGIWGKTEALADGTSVVIDAAYVKHSLMEPNSQIVKGFTPQMPSFKGRLNDAQIQALADFIKSLK